MNPDVQIRPMTADDWPGAAEVYREGILTGDATFNSEVPTWEAWDCGHIVSCRLVAVDGSGLLGWTALTPVSDRCVYGGVAELAVYVAARARGRGVGRALLDALVTASEAAGIWSLQSGIFPENVGSVRLHERAGFRLVGRRERLGQMGGQWRDVLMFERRSQVVGT